MSRRSRRFEVERHVPGGAWVREDAFVHARRTGHLVPLVATERDEDARKRERHARDALLRRAAERFAEALAEKAVSSPRVGEMGAALLEHLGRASLTADEAVASAKNEVGGNRQLTRRARDVGRNDPELVELARRLGYVA